MLNINDDFCLIFSRGVLANTAEFLGCTCFQDDQDKLDWTKTYSLPKKYQQDPGKGTDGCGCGSVTDETNVRIPLPFSRTWDPTQDRLDAAWMKSRK